jgi:hypothetical protein
VTDRPSVAYDIWPYGGGNSAVTSATLLIPTSAWDTNYVAVDAYNGYLFPNSTSAGTFNPWVALIASEDATTVKLTPTADIVGSTLVSTGLKGVTQTYGLNRGEIIAFVQSEELIGTPIQSDKPIAAFGGIDCMYAPDGMQACDSGHQQIPPVKALGHEYVVARYRDRFDDPGKGVVDHREWPPVRVLGAVDGTMLSYDPAPPPNAPTTIGKGQLGEFRATAPFVVRSQDAQHPFYTAAYMTGCTVPAPEWVQGALQNCPGDPEFVNVIPPQEYLSQYTFFTDPTYPETELVVVRPKANGASFADVSLDCLGNVTGWQPVDAAGNYQFARVDLVTGNFQPVGACNNGLHEMHSAARSASPFGAGGRRQRGERFRIRVCLASTPSASATHTPRGRAFHRLMV